MQKPSFSVCVICKDMSRTIPRLMDSLVEFQARGGEVIAVDTGSSDGSAEVFRSRGATVSEVGERFVITIDAETAKAINERFVVEGEEPIVQEGSRLFHFANARNYGASLASNDWVSWIDADEAFTVLKLDKIEEIIADPDLEHTEYDFVFAHGPDGVTPAVAFVQSKMYRRSRMFWTGAVHELVTPRPDADPRVATGPNRRFVDSSIFRLEHWQEPGKGHRSHYLPGLGYDAYKKMVQKDDLATSADRQAHYLAREMNWLGRPKSAIKLFKEHIAMNGWPAERAQSMIFIGDAWGTLGDQEQQLDWYNRAFMTDPTRRESLIKTAYVYKAKGNHAACAAYASAALEIPFHPYYANDMTHYREAPYALRYHSRGWSGNVQGAREDILKALEFEPYHPEFLRDTQFYFEYGDQGIEGWMRFPELTWIYETAKRYQRIAELGSWCGRSTHAFCSGALKGDGEVWAIDHFQGSDDERDLTKQAAVTVNPWEKFQKNVGHFENLHIVKKPVEQAVRDFPNGFFDLVFIDAEHSAVAVERDIFQWLPKCRRLLAGHDYFVGWQELKNTVDAVFPQLDGVVDTIWYKYVNPPPVNPLLQYLTDCVKSGFTISFVKKGDGEVACMNGEVGANCDGHPYSEDLSWKLKVAFHALEKISGQREGRTWVNIVPFEDQDFYNILLHRHDANWEPLKAFWTAVRQSDVRKTLVGPARLKRVADMLKAEFVEIPLINAFSEYAAIKEKLMWVKPGEMVIFCAGPPAKVWIAHLLERDANISCIDAGSAWDPLVVEGGTRTEQLPKWFMEQQYGEWLAEVK